MKAFKEQITSLAFLERFNNTNVDLFQTVRLLESDLKLIKSRELEAITKSGINEMHPTAAVLLHGYGLPTSNVNSLGPSLIFWAPMGVILDTDWSLLDDSLSL
jgi:hypothetical protein